MKIQYSAVVTSTNKSLKERLEKKGIKEFPYAFAAGFQRKGRGFGENSWHSENGKNALFSVVFKPNFLRVEHQFLLNQVLSLSLLDSLRKISNPIVAERLRLKWPNDIYYIEQKMGESHEYKIGGILFEVGVLGPSLSWAIMGCGINLNQRKFPQEILRPISLYQITHTEMDVKEARQILIENLEEDYQAFCLQLSQGSVEETRANYQKKYLENLLFYGQQRSYIFQGKVNKARITDVDEYGQAILKTLDERCFTCGLKELQYVFEP